MRAIQTINSFADKAERLKTIIQNKCYITDGDFTLASGANSNFFFDLKVALLDPEGASLAAELILERINVEEVAAIGGLVIGACPIASAVCVKSHERGTPIKAFYVRKEPKARGTQKMIEGAVLSPGEKVVLVDDVTTSGGSVLQAAALVRNLGCVVVKVISIVDREQGAKENLAAEGLELDALFSKRDFELAHEKMKRA
jgi:orotate phosphoribosyltransferase